MICKLARAQIDGWQLDRSQLGTDELLSREIAEHVNQCELCAQYCDDRELNGYLQNIGQIEVPEGLAERVITTAQRYKSKRTWRKPLFQYGIVAGFVVAFSVAFLINQPTSEIDSTNIESINYAEVLSNIELHVGEVSNTQIQLTLQQAIEHASMTVKLPAHIALAGYDGVTQLNWQTNLKSGNNIMVLPLQLLEPIDGIVHIEVEHQGVKKVFRINVNALEHSNNEIKTI